MNEIGHGLHRWLDQADRQSGAPVLGDGVGDGDCNREVHQGVGAGFQSEPHGWKIGVLRMARKYVLRRGLSLSKAGGGVTGPPFDKLRARNGRALCIPAN